MFKEYLEQERKIIYEEWKLSDPDSWLRLKMKLEVLNELDQMITNDAKNTAFYRQNLEELDQIEED